MIFDFDRQDDRQDGKWRAVFVWVKWTDDNHLVLFDYVWRRWFWRDVNAIGWDGPERGWIYRVKLPEDAVVGASE